MEKYDHKEIEAKWQKEWEKSEIYHASNDSKKPKKYILIEFPYPSGEGLHMGHLRPYTAGDVTSRYYRMKGFETMYPMGWDAFGLPAENYAIKKGVHPSVSTAKNVENAKRQLQSWGMGFDWSREVNTTDPNYYKWTQWIFLQFFKAGLAYEATGLINWCPKDKTGLANEEVVDGKCERCGTEVEKKEMRQWYLKITAYAEKLLEGLKNLPEWPEPVKLQQENWIGKSEGAEIEFQIQDQKSTNKNALLIHGLNGHVNENWKPWLKGELEKNNWAVIVPSLPKPDHPVINEWNEILVSLFKENSVVVGHSLGCAAALNLVQTAGKKVNKLILVAPVNPRQDWEHLRASYPDGDWDAVKSFADIKFDWQKISRLADQIIIYYSDNDPYIPLESIDFYRSNLPNAIFKFMPSKGHLNRKAGMIEFPELLTTILSSIKVFTTRPDTLFGATYMVLAPEHPLVEQITTPEQKNYVINYVIQTEEKTELQRTALEKEKIGVFTGALAINPAIKEQIPVWVADYVLMNYGTGAIMAVPAHDERDFEFAKKYNLPIKPVITPSNSPFQGENPVPPLKGEVRRGKIEELYTGEGILINSDKFNGMDSEKAKAEITKFVGGNKKVQYKLRDWVFSRQRYWGEPIPLVHCSECGTVPVPEKDLPVVLPEVEKYEPTGTGESPLAVIDEWVNVKCPKCGSPAKRETNTMPQWAGSSWYWLRYTDFNNDKEFASKKMLKYWTPVDIYFGGMEHTTLHLLYSRFWNLFLYDQGLVTTQEPYLKRVPHGIILAADGEKMSKSRGNVVNPDEIVEKFGADTLRMYEMFLGPHEATVSWNDQGIMGVRRFLDKVWKFNSSFSSPLTGEDGRRPDEGDSSIHKLIKKITEDIEQFKFNTAIAGFMEFLSAKGGSASGGNNTTLISKSDWEIFLILLAPFAPHITEELWHQLGHKTSIHLESWPKYDERLVVADKVTIVVQVLGRIRATLEAPTGLDQAEIKKLALSDANIKKYLEGKQVVKEIFIKDRLINFVVK